MPAANLRPTQQSQPAANNVDSTSRIRPVSTLLVIAILCFGLWIRVGVGYQPHSGQDNHHGSRRAYGGDYEAQRHWMELTLNLPIGEWYWYDLTYWGLDYPPLTAYVSWLCGVGSSVMVGPHTMTLDDSRGYEGDAVHKAYMRVTVLVTDALVYLTAVVWILKRLWNTNQQQRKGVQSFYWALLLAVSQPSVILIDHGHFQYNTIALGLTLWSLYFMSQTNFMTGCVLGSIFFCLSLNFKQMTLYYAPCIFAYLLGRCCSAPRSFIPRFVTLGVTVIATFLILWWPFLVYGPTSSKDLPAGSQARIEALFSVTPSDVIFRGKHVLRRIFPFERGLFEGKVSNLWCALDTKPVNIRQRIPAHLQPMCALAVTLALMLPACVRLFLVGQQQTSSTTKEQLQQPLTALLWGTTSSALAFFLASFQVHEKSLLLALAPASLLFLQEKNGSVFYDWFSMVAVWTLWPLLVIDRLQVAYVCTVLIFISLVQLRPNPTPKPRTPSTIQWGWIMTTRLCYLGMLALHVLEAVVVVPANLPDLFPVLWSVIGCAMCCLAWVRTCAYLWSEYQAPEADGKAKME